jgi:hypothetical protein
MNSLVPAPAPARAGPHPCTTPSGQSGPGSRSGEGGAVGREEGRNGGREEGPGAGAGGAGTAWQELGVKPAWQTCSLCTFSAPDQ